MGPPGGGPEDKDPPTILYVEPASGTTHVDPDTPVYLIFSEPVTAASLSEALYITPSPATKPKIKVTGSKVRIKLSEPVPEDRTLVVTIGSGVTDLRRNQMEESLSIAITAGDRISSGRISGRVFADRNLKGIMVSAWNLLDTLTIDPIKQLAPIVTQTNAQGDYILDYLAEGTYRIICWDDKDRNRKLDPGRDRIGIGWEDVVLKMDSSATMNLYPVMHDTTQLRPLLFSAQDNRHLTARFTLPVGDRAAEIMNSVEITDSFNSLEVIDSWWNSSDSSQLIFLTTPQSAGAVYLFHLSGDSLPMVSKSSELPDTNRLRVISSYPENAARNVSGNAEGWIGFDDKIVVENIESLLSLTVSDSIDKEISIWQNEPTIIRWKVIKPVQAGKLVKLSLNTDYVRDYAGNSFIDTSWTIAFEIYNPSEMGSITGKLSGADRNGIVVAANQIDRWSKQFQSSVADDSSFALEHLPEGKFVLWAYRDMDGDGIYDHGSLNPFAYSERFTVHPDTIQVRARWETGGLIFNLSE